MHAWEDRGTEGYDRNQIQALVWSKSVADVSGPSDRASHDKNGKVRFKKCICMGGVVHVVFLSACMHACYR